MHESLTAIQVPLEIFPWTPGGSRTPGWEPLRLAYSATDYEQNVLGNTKKC